MLIINWHLYENFQEKHTVKKTNVLFIIHVRTKVVSKIYTVVQKEVPQLQNGHGTCIPNLYKH